MMEFPWFKQYPKRVAHEIQLNEYPNLVALFEDSCKRFSSQVAYENMGVQLTYADVDRLSGHFAAYLQQDLGLKKGERIAIQMPNVLQFPIAFFGALRAGLIVVNTNPLYTAREMEYQFKDADISAIVIVSNFCFNLEKVLGHMAIKHIIITELGDMLGTVKGAIVNFVVKHIKKMVPAFSIPQADTFKNALRKGESLSLIKPTLSLDDIAVLQYTGGTTGVSKGAQLSHSNLIAHNSMLKQWFIPYLEKKVSNIMITAIPLHHIFALTVNGVLM